MTSTGDAPETPPKRRRQPNRYTRILARIFELYYREGATEVTFPREDINRIADELGVERPDNTGDVLYYFKFRQPLPPVIQEKAPEGHVWILRSAGRVGGVSRYGLYAVDPDQVRVNILPNPLAPVAKLPDATPGMITMHALDDEQALLAKLRYNRLIDTFTGITCYSLQSHLRTQVNREQKETDEVYIGVDRRGAQYVFPVQAKGHRDRLGTAQIEDDVRVCEQKWPHLICRPVAAQFMPDEVIALFLFEPTEDGIKQLSEKHYRLVPPDDVDESDLQRYRERPLND